MIGGRRGVIRTGRRTPGLDADLHPDTLLRIKEPLLNYATPLRLTTA